MGNARPTNFPMRQLGRTLRRLRVRAGLTQEDAGKRLRFSSKKMSRLELGQLPTYHELLAMLDLYGVIVNDWEPIVALFDKAQERGWWHAYGIDDRGFVPVEAEALKVRSYEIGFVPGLMQTERYMRSVFAAAREPLTGEALENNIAVRLRRQQRLIEEPVLQFHTIVDETALRRPVCDRAAQRDQIRALLERTALSNVVLQVIPQSIGAHDGLYGNFLIASFPDPEEPDLAYVEYGFGALHVEKPTEAEAARLLFGHLAGKALNQEDSVVLLEQVVEEI